jgi:ribosomal protein L11 methyltransferase
MAADRWTEVTVRVAPADVDLVSTTLADVTGQPVAIEPQIRRIEQIDFGYEDLDAPVTVRGYAEPALANDRRTAIEAALRQLKLSAPVEAPSYSELDPTDWAEEWKRFYDIRHISERLVIRPSWLEYDAREGEIVLDLDPGAAFGTGQHETTRLCLGAIERHLEPDADVIDVGCGSGVLAIAAAKLGARRVRAVDIDPDTIRVTDENAQANGVSDAVIAAAGSLGAQWPWPDALPEETGLLVANISSGTVLLLLPEIADALAPGGRAVLSGFLARDAAEIETAVRTARLTVLEKTAEGDWACLVAARP